MSYQKQEWKNYPDTSTPISAERLNYIEDGIFKQQKDILEIVFPIGSTYITQTNTNPETILGFGTWERLKGKVCLGLDEDDSNMNEIGKTGGEKSHTLTVNEMPRHRHWDGTNENQLMGMVTGSASCVTTIDKTFGATEYEGGSQPHNNMQPYEIPGYMWIRRG